jgi:hypothetical protein
MAPLLLAFALVLTALYWYPGRRWMATWGASPTDLALEMAGDRLISGATYRTTLAITIDADPMDVWAWLVQMGYRRGGLYSYDWLDRLFGFLDRPSAATILPEFQRLEIGDEIPVGRGMGFPVALVQPGRALVLSGTSDGLTWVWQFGLFPLGGGRTRLISRTAGQVPRGFARWCFVRVLEPAAFLMTRRMLIGLKQRAEGHATYPPIGAAA